MNDRFDERISAYLDGELDGNARAAFERELEDSPELAAQVDALRSVVDDAKRVENPGPATDLWPAIEARLEPRQRVAEVVDLDEERSRRGFVLPRWQAIAAVLAVAVISASIGWLLRGDPSPAPNPGVSELAVQDEPTATQRPRGSVGIVEPDATFARFADEREHMAESIVELERLLRARADHLDEETLAVVEDNLIRIDTAIDELMNALGEDPESDYLQSHLSNSMRRKVRLLENATRLTRREI